MAQTFTTEAIVLRRTPYREHDRRLVLYTHDRGKVMTIGRGTQKLISKNLGHIEPANRIDVMIAYSLATDKLASAKLRDAYPCARRSFLGLSLLSYVIEFMDRSVHGQEPDLALYESLVLTLEAIDRALAAKELRSPDELKLLVRFFALKALSHIGILPHLPRNTPQDVFEFLRSAFPLSVNEFLEFPLVHSPKQDTIRAADQIITNALERQLHSAAFV